MQRMLRSSSLALAVVVVLLGCSEPESGDPSPGGPTATPSRFDPRTAVALRGRVTWDGEVPVVAVFNARISLSADGFTHRRIVRPNPNAPAIHQPGRGIGNAVVYLRGLDPEWAPPWDHPPVRVEQRDFAFHVCQGEHDSPYGFVRRGDSIDMVSLQQDFHSLHASGAAFFALPFPDPGVVRSRCLPRKGVVELASAAGYYWMRAYLFVDDHPCYTRTDAAGRFVLPQVPPGRYEVVCWLPSWKEQSHQRDPETGLVTRLTFRPPVERVQTVNIAPSVPPPELHFTFSAAGFTE